MSIPFFCFLQKKVEISTHANLFRVALSELKKHLPKRAITRSKAGNIIHYNEINKSIKSSKRTSGQCLSFSGFL